MSRWLDLALWPFRRLLDPLRRTVKRKLVDLIQFALEPTQAELHTLNDKMDRILDINLAPDVLREFRIHNETLRAILADCDLVRDMNPLFNSVLRDLMRLQLQSEELAWRLEQCMPWSDTDGSESGANPEREAA
jgi:hypothetical protein